MQVRSCCRLRAGRHDRRCHFQAEHEPGIDVEETGGAGVRCDVAVTDTGAVVAAPPVVLGRHLGVVRTDSRPLPEIRLKRRKALLILVGVPPGSGARSSVWTQIPV